MSQVYKRGPKTPQMNMTPLIDVTFQLIIFFLLINNIITEEQVELIPPDLEDPKTFKMETENRVTVNIAPLPFNRADRIQGNPLAFAGQAAQVKVGMKSFAMEDLGPVTDLLKAAVDQNEEVEVLLRADCALYYKDVQPIMGAITAAGIGKINLVAYLPEGER